MIGVLILRHVRPSVPLGLFWRESLRTLRTPTATSARAKQLLIQGTPRYFACISGAELRNLSASWKRGSCSLHLEKQARKFLCAALPSA